jgi:undecaprenyl phosphate-alpha-L-ara4FN deformylase
MTTDVATDPILVGLRVDVDTYRGTRDGVPRLIEILAEFDLKASFFFSVGPDNMGRHLWRLLKPKFLLKMLRSKAASLYGWDILLRGTFWPGAQIAQRLGAVIRATDKAGHEIGLHAWDHHRWQSKVEQMSAAMIQREIQLGMEALTKVLGRRVSCSAAAGWKCTEQVLLEKEKFGFAYNSDCRGSSVFKPRILNQDCTAQIPVTLPTYDEMVGQHGVTDENYNGQLLAMIKPKQLNVLTIHAEVEGIAKAALFREFLQRARQQHIMFVPLQQLVPAMEQIPRGSICAQPIAGREGTLCWQTRVVN